MKVYSMTPEQMQHEFFDRMMELTDDELREIIRIAQTRLSERQRANAYQPEDDPILRGEGLIDGDPDLSERVEDLLYTDKTDSRGNKLG